MGQASDNSLKEASEVGILELRKLYKAVASIGTDEEVFDDLMRRDFCGRLVKTMAAGILEIRLSCVKYYSLSRTQRDWFRGLTEGFAGKNTAKNPLSVK